MNISASDVKKLRDMSGAGMMDAKEALKESNGDFDAAVSTFEKKDLLIQKKDLTETQTKEQSGSIYIFS